MKKAEKGDSRFIQRYFKDFMPAVIEKSVFAELDNLSIVLSFYFTDCKERWTLTLEQGRIVGIEKGPFDNPEVLFELDSNTFSQIIAGYLSPQQSFYMNRSKIEGDILKGLKLAAIFESFIKQFPYEGADEDGIDS